VRVDLRREDSVLKPPAPAACMVILDRGNEVVASLGEGEYSRQDWSTVRNQAAGTFVPGRLSVRTAPVSTTRATFLLVEWLESGRVTKLRRLS